jgi:hypothetical protein
MGLIVSGCGWCDFEGAARSRQCGEHFEDKESDCTVHANNERKRVLSPLDLIQAARLT